MKTHGWDKEFPDCPKPCKDGETKGNLVPPLPADCLAWVCEKEGFKEGTMEHTILEKKMGFQHGVVLGELMHAMMTARPDITCSVTTPNKFLSAPSECCHQLLKGLTKHLQTTKSWGFKCCRPKDRFWSGPPDSDCQESALLPEAVGNSQSTFPNPN